jgi:hypothetical protein
VPVSDQPRSAGVWDGSHPVMLRGRRAVAKGHRPDPLFRLRR